MFIPFLNACNTFQNTTVTKMHQKKHLLTQNGKSFSGWINNQGRSLIQDIDMFICRKVVNPQTFQMDSFLFSIAITVN